MPDQLLLDVGGTEIKATRVTAAGRPVGPARHYPAKATESAATIVANFVSIITAAAAGDALAGVGLAFPGPFDYAGGVSLMRGLGKYDALYGMPLTPAIQHAAARTLPWLTHARFAYIHDIAAFGLGETRGGVARDCERFMCLAIGTGAGSAFVANRRLVTTGAGVPPHGWLYDTPFRAGIVDDYVSARGLTRLAKCHTGVAYSGAQLAALAAAGDEAARATFTAFGQVVAQAVAPFVKDFAPQALVLGGQIAKSFTYFGQPLTTALAAHHVACLVEPDFEAVVNAGIWARLNQN
ncbi:ROK family protein [Lacticaseibacillus parakribbianus]|uniref:ROK family protein n=1 Tax=Lacticaseibacillus parakribbianus TaxID=2970927 RepID=UPI0021CB4ABF|nr:ROK family protein [Lacticaseibacillus parakribbianus]